MLLLVSGATKTVNRLKGSPHFGHLLSPQSRNDPDWFVSTGLPWAAENGAFSGFDSPSFIRMLDAIQDKPGCLFVVCPDVIGNAAETLSLFGQWREAIASRSLPVAYVAQDGQDQLPVPWDEFDALFIGGSTEFKVGRHAETLTREARTREKWIHMGRVNTRRRMRLASAWGCDSVDGTSFSWFPDARLPKALDHLGQLSAQGWLL